MESEFKVIKAKVCPNSKCNAIVPETWVAAYEVNWCPTCNYGYDEEKFLEWRKSNNIN